MDRDTVREKLAEQNRIRQARYHLKLKQGILDKMNESN